MRATILQADCGVTLVGGGELAPGDLARALARAPRLVAADGGADRALAAGHMPEMVIGDLDSLSPEGRSQVGPQRIAHIPEQDTTDFDKALRSIAAPFVLAVGFTGARVDHMLGAFNVLARHPDRRCLVLGAQDVCFLAPCDLALRLVPGTRLSLFPMGPVTGRSTGLHWPVDGIDFAPGGVTGISNRVSAPEVRLSFSASRMLVLLPASALDAALAGLARSAGD
ncbi:MAG: thiamine diphosphokinase [Alkalilacustris sp.]